MFFFFFRLKRSANTEIYLALPPNNIKTSKQDSPPTLIRLDGNAPNKFKGKFPTPIERFIQRIQNYFSVYNPPEYLNDLRPGINNPETGEDQVNQFNDTQIILPCNGTSTIVIIPVPLENENVSTDYNVSPTEPETYKIPTTLKPNCHSDATIPSSPVTATPKPNCPDTVTLKPTCPEEITTVKQKCPDVTTAKPKCPEEVTTVKPKPATTPKPTPCADEVTTPKPKCPEATTPKPKCPETTTQKPLCPPKYGSNPSDFKPISGYGPSEVPPINLVAKPILGSTVIYYYKNPTTLPPNSPSYYVPGDPTPYEEHTRRPKPPIARLKQLLFPRLYAAFHPEEEYK